MINFLVWKQHTKKHKTQGWQGFRAKSFGEIALHTPRTTVRAFKLRDINLEVVFVQHFRSLCNILFEDVQPYPERKVVLPGIKVGDILLSQKTGHPVSIQF